jgi:hypothetical protein
LELVEEGVGLCVMDKTGCIWRSFSLHFWSLYCLFWGWEDIPHLGRTKECEPEYKFVQYVSRFIRNIIIMP